MAGASAIKMKRYIRIYQLVRHIVRWQRVTAMGQRPPTTTTKTINWSLVSSKVLLVVMLMTLVFSEGNCCLQHYYGAVHGIACIGQASIE